MTDLMRSEFEAWAKDHEIYGDDGERFPMARLSGCYYENVQTQAAWEAWQASRERLVIELPVRSCEAAVSGMNYHKGWNDCLDWSGKNIEEHGIKVKS